MYLGMGNHLGLFTEPSDRTEDQELEVWVVGGQGPLQNPSNTFKTLVFRMTFKHYMLSATLVNTVHDSGHNCMD